VYGSRLVSTGGFILDIPLLALFLHDTHAIAFYSMAKSLSAPLAVVGQSISTALFRQFAGADRIGRNVIVMVSATTLVLAIGYIVLARPIIHFLLPPTYSAIYGYLMLWTVTTCLQSLYQLPTNYLQAQGMGGTLGILSASFGLSAALGYVLLIPRFGIWGACISALIAVAIWTGGSWFFYFRVTAAKAQTA
jgi:O-antigen/teichoic acid export membrane protein